MTSKAKNTNTKRMTDKEIKDKAKEDAKREKEKEFEKFCKVNYKIYEPEVYKIKKKLHHGGREEVKRIPNIQSGNNEKNTVEDKIKYPKSK